VSGSETAESVQRDVIEGSEKKKSFLSKIETGLLVPLVTAYAYALSFAYQAGYLSHFGLPVEFVDVTLQQLLRCGSVAILGMYLAFQGLDLLLSLRPSSISRGADLKFVECAVFLVLQIVLLKVVDATTWLWVVILMLFSGLPIFYYFLFPIWAHSTVRGYWQRVEAHIE